MTPHTPSHGQIGHAFDTFHLLNGSMACAARNLSPHVRFVIEMDKPWEGVHLDPRDLLFRVPESPQLHDFRIFWNDIPVASHAPFDRRDASKRGTTCGAVAELAAQLVVAGVNDMTERDRLLRCVRFGSGRPAHGDDNKEAAHEEHHERASRYAKRPMAPHRSVYRYAAISRASLTDTPVSGMAVCGSTSRGARIQRVMF